MVFINKTSSKPYYEQLMLGIKEEIISGLLKPGDQLPSVREMARQLMMNPNTVSKAYKLLESQDVIITVKGKGTYIKTIDQELRNESQILKLKKQLNDLVIEANYLTISKAEMNAWLEEIYNHLKGESRCD
ncbi:GntR family transcriptional regulator [Enterococcus rivorum]|uniref:GntR family transcriptional regulator n=1 Tax=Enterococcus rivorum TaxID=762845 RepID=A0A1E5KXV6_9ENTE|nr:GntR family transcriptional regulator [Enterococcus rivorum]MBP2099649.1 GntR family transcriptional regulator [Enterococcus rivorum]OEH82677.1 GntR family transcriptional regulator [Enterococcus rivorum]